MPGSVFSVDLDRSSDPSPEPRPHRGHRLRGTSNGGARHHPAPPGSTEPQFHQRRPRSRPRSGPEPDGPDRRRRRRRSRSPASPSPSSLSTCSCSTCSSCSTCLDDPDRATRRRRRRRRRRDAIHTDSDGQDGAPQQALVPRPLRRSSLASESSAVSGPDEYTVYPDGRISDDRDHRRRPRRPGGRSPPPRPRRPWRRGGRGEPYDDWDPDLDPDWDRDRDRYRGDEKGDMGWGKRRRRSKEEAKGLMVAALVFLASFILCSD